MSVNIRSLLDEVDKKLEQVLNHHIEQYIQQYVSSLLTQLKLLEHPSQPITLNKDVFVDELIDLTMANSTKPKDKMQDIIHVKIEMTENKKVEKELCNGIEEPEPESESFIRGLTGERGPVFCSGLTGERGPVVFVKEEQVVEKEEEEQVDEEEEVVEEQVVEEQEEEQEVEEEVVEEEEEEQSIETETKEEEEEDLFEIEIDDITYCTNNEESGFIWEVTDAGDIGNKVGYLKEGEPIFYNDENNKK
jgi:hypothetical protein